MVGRVKGGGLASLVKDRVKTKTYLVSHLAGVSKARRVGGSGQAIALAGSTPTHGTWSSCDGLLRPRPKQRRRCPRAPCVRLSHRHATLLVLAMLIGSMARPGLRFPGRCLHATFHLEINKFFCRAFWVPSSTAARPRPKVLLDWPWRSDPVSTNGTTCP